MNQINSARTRDLIDFGGLPEFCKVLTAKYRDI